jgi:type IV pilus assembly protein PilN
MIRINLLPRDEQPRQRGVVLPKVGTFAPLALVFCAAIAIGSAHVYQGQRIAKLNATIAEEEAESRRLAPEIAKIKRLNQQRQDLNDRLDVITRLDTDRYFRVHLLDEMNRSMPGYMWLTRFEDIGGDTYAVEGVTFSNFLVSDFLQNVTESGWFSGIELLVTEKGEISDVQVVKFKARAHAVRKTPAPDAFAG